MERWIRKSIRCNDGQKKAIFTTFLAIFWKMQMRCGDLLQITLGGMKDEN